MSALPPKADMCSALADVRFAPIADIREAHDPRLPTGEYRCKISTRAWPFGKYLWLRVLCLNDMGAPNFLGSPKITVRLGHQFAFFHLVACGSRPGIHLPRPVP